VCSVAVTAVVPQRWHRSGALNKLALLLITVRLRTCQMLHACGTTRPLQLEVERLSPMSDHSSAQASAGGTIAECTADVVTAAEMARNGAVDAKSAP